MVSVEELSQQLSLKGEISDVFLRDLYGDWCYVTSLSATWIERSSLPSASLLCQQTERERMLYRGIWTGLGGGLYGSHEVQQGQV